MKMLCLTLSLPPFLHFSVQKLMSAKVPRVTLMPTVPTLLAATAAPVMMATLAMEQLAIVSLDTMHILSLFMQRDSCKGAQRIEKNMRISLMNCVKKSPCLLSPDIDECATGNDSCDSNGNCTDTDGSYECSCKPGFTGDGFNCTSKYTSST